MDRVSFLTILKVKSNVEDWAEESNENYPSDLRQTLNTLTVLDGRLCLVRKKIFGRTSSEVGRSCDHEASVYNFCNFQKVKFVSGFEGDLNDRMVFNKNQVRLFLLHNYNLNFYLSIFHTLKSCVSCVRSKIGSVQIIREIQMLESYCWRFEDQNAVNPWNQFEIHRWRRMLMIVKGKDLQLSVNFVMRILQDVRFWIIARVIM